MGNKKSDENVILPKSGRITDMRITGVDTDGGFMFRYHYHYTSEQKEVECYHPMCLIEKIHTE